MLHSTTKQTYIFIGLVLFMVGWAIFLIVYGAETLVNHLGAENGYLVMFLVALFGGVSSIGGVSYVATLITLASGGLDPFYLAIASGLGVSIGDTAYFYLGKNGLRNLVIESEQQKGMLTRKITEWVKRMTDWFDTKPEYMTYIGVYMIVAFTPTPNDLLTIALGVTNRKYVSTIVALVLANMTHTYLIAQFGAAIPFL